MTNEPITSTILTPPPYEVLARSLHEAIGLKLDLQNMRIFVTDLGGCVYSFDLNGMKKRKMYEDQGTYTGITIAYVDNTNSICPVWQLTKHKKVNNASG